MARSVHWPAAGVLLPAMVRGARRKTAASRWRSFMSVPQRIKGSLGDVPVQGSRGLFQFIFGQLDGRASIPFENLPESLDQGLIARADRVSIILVGGLDLRPLRRRGDGTLGGQAGRGLRLRDRGRRSDGLRRGLDLV